MPDNVINKYEYVYKHNNSKYMFKISRTRNNIHELFPGPLKRLRL